jgi:hypothetical protein
MGCVCFSVETFRPRMQLHKTILGEEAKVAACQDDPLPVARKRNLPHIGLSPVGRFKCS